MDYNVSFLDVASEDEYHFDKGLPPENIGNIEELVEDHPEKEDKKLYRDSLEVVIRRIKNPDRLMPLGNAKNLKEDEYINLSFSMNGKSSCQNSLRDYNLTIDNEENVYNCCFQIFPLRG